MGGPMSIDAPASPGKARSKGSRADKPAESNGAGPAGASGSDVTDLLAMLTSLCAGDFGVRREPREGIMGQVVERANALAALNERRTRELVRASRVIGREGRMTERLDEVGSDGDWSTGAAAVNSLI